MRIRKVYVKSFGPLKNKEVVVSPGLNVIYGPNGSGKTSLAEFIGTCLSPMDRKDRYPSCSKDDSGSVLMYEYDGETTVTIRGRSRFGRVPECVKGISPDLFRTVFSIQRESLADLEPLSPSAEDDPGYSMIHTAAESMKRIERSVFETDEGGMSELEALEVEMKELDESIGVLMKEVKRYGEYASQKKAVTERLLLESDDSVEAEEKRRYQKLREDHKADYERLKELSSARAELGFFEWAGNSEAAEFKKLRKELSDSLEELESLKAYMEEPINELGDKDPSSILFYSDDITWLDGGRRDYARQFEELRRSRAQLAEAKMVPDSKKKSIVFGRSTRSCDVTKMTETVNDLTRRTEAYERMVSRITSALGINATETAHAVAELVRLRDAASIVSKHEEKLRTTKEKADAALEEMERLTERYGGQEGFLDCLRKTRAAKEMDSEITDIRAGLSRHGLDPDAPICAVEYIGIVDGTEGLKRRLEDLDSKMARIMDSEELEALMDRKNVLSNRKSALLWRGIDAAIGCAIARKVDVRALYSGSGEWKNAEDYLSAMTGYECRIRYDREFLVECNGVERPLREMGSGMRSMASLALKIAAAERIGDGMVPIILDEVLAGMDTQSKSSACRVLKDVAKKMQVILLTGEQETKEIMTLLPEVTLINLTHAYKAADHDEELNNS